MNGIKHQLKNTVLTITILLITISQVVVAQQNNIRYVPNEAFGFGEKLEYKVGMLSGVLKGLGGSGGISIAKKPVKITLSNGEVRDCYDINFWVNSEGVVDMTYSIRDKYRTIVDIGGIFPYEFHQRIREGNYKLDFSARFDQINNLAIVGDKQYKVEEYIQDIISALFYVRTMNLSAMKNGETITLRNFYKDTTFALPVRIIRRETIKVRAGTFRAILVQPVISEGSPFKFNNMINVWLTDDARKIPIKVSTSIILGDVGAELFRYSGVRGKIDAKVK